MTSISAGPFRLEIPPNGVAILYETDAKGEHQLPGGVSYLEALIQFSGELIRLRAKLTEAEASANAAHVCCDSYAIENQQFHDTIDTLRDKLTEADRQLGIERNQTDKFWREIAARDATIAKLREVLAEARSAMVLDDMYNTRLLDRIDAALVTP